MLISLLIKLYTASCTYKKSSCLINYCTEGLAKESLAWTTILAGKIYIMCYLMSKLKTLAQIFVKTYILNFSVYFFLFLVCCMCFRLLKRINDDATWISELEMFHFMLSMYWWVYVCMDELQRITWCHGVCGV